LGGANKTKKKKKKKKNFLIMISGFRSEADKICALLGYYAASSDNFYGRFGTAYRRLSSWVLTMKMGPIGCPEMSVTNCHYSLRNRSEKRSSEELSQVTLFVGPRFVSGIF
jgi:hypothetical protein